MTNPKPPPDHPWRMSDEDSYNTPEWKAFRDDLKAVMAAVGVREDMLRTDRELFRDRFGTAPYTDHHALHNHSSPAHWYFDGDCKTAPYHHIFRCAVEGKGGRKCLATSIHACTRFVDRYEPCRCAYAQEAGVDVGTP